MFLPLEGSACTLVYYDAGFIGSGAIESAHPTVIQKRVKLSGQRWTIKGTQNMLNIGVINKNQQWSKIIEMSKFGLKATGLWTTTWNTPIFFSVLQEYNTLK